MVTSDTINSLTVYSVLNLTPSYGDHGMRGDDEGRPPK